MTKPQSQLKILSASVKFCFLVPQREQVLLLGKNLSAMTTMHFLNFALYSIHHLYHGYLAGLVLNSSINNNNTLFTRLLKGISRFRPHTTPGQRQVAGQSDNTVGVRPLAGVSRVAIEQVAHTQSQVPAVFMQVFVMQS